MYRFIPSTPSPASRLRAARPLRGVLFGVLAALTLTLAACDASESDADGETRISGRVEAGQAASAAARAQAGASLEGATVTAARVASNGQLRALGGEATTDAEGAFALDTEASADPVLVRAEGDGVALRALLEAEAAADASVTAPPLTAETTGEADVYTEGRAASSTLTVADVAAYVDADVAARLAAGTATAAEVAAAIAAGADAEAAYARGEADGDRVERARADRRASYATLRTSLFAAASVGARDEAAEDFEQRYAYAYARAGLSAEAQAGGAQAGTSATVRFSGGASTFPVRRQAEVFAAFATARAVEAAFEAEGATSAQLDALAAARAALVADVRASASASALAQAKADYEAAVEAELAAALGTSMTALSAAKVAVTNAKTTLEASVTAAADAARVAAAHATFYASAETSAEAALGGLAKASFAASVLVLLGGF